MAVESYDPTRQAVVVTPAAVEHFRRQLAKEEKSRAVRLSVKESGCTGFMYVVDLVEDGRPGDVYYALSDDVALYIDPESLSVVTGTEIDYVLEGVNRQLKFINPNAQDYCGCGESFSVN
ncbi:HesB/IscA family protein [Marinimicrobium sp. ARAG 43.8]|uniref:HesB/IscA family protein n=1 Tax=Marinimicrobium sp. ARAG 43.8 TaxID=3418719 RepID=UPI003CFB531E